jgi:aryl-alcohol dehydrogenase-like predicted oxidoreductase
LLTGSKPGAADFRGFLPRFSGEHGAKNAERVLMLERFAREHEMTNAQLAVSWVLAKRPGFVPLVGVKTESQLKDALGAFDRPLTSADIAALERLVPAGAFGGDRYGAEQMKHLDSER